MPTLFSLRRYDSAASCVHLSVLIYLGKGIEILTEHSFRTTSPTTSKAALQCLANALLSAAWTRQIFVNLGYSAKAVARLKVDS